jgi:hypothetical protein
VQIFLQVFRVAKAAPGGSNHSNGNAVDLGRVVNGDWKHNELGNQKHWRSSWEFWWLFHNASRFGFKNYKAESWHWEWWG